MNNTQTRGIITPFTHLQNLGSSALYNEELRIDDFDRQKLERDFLTIAALSEKNEDLCDSPASTGHKNTDYANPQNQLQEILKSYTIDVDKQFTPLEVRFIIKARIISWLAGGCGVSIKTLDTLLENSSYINFAPPIPKHCSRSISDVIPAAYLLKYFLDENSGYDSLLASDIKAFVDGNFVQLGYAASLMPRINKIWTLYLHSTLVAAVIFKSNNSNYKMRAGVYSDSLNTLLNIMGELNPDNKDTQDILSIRGIPQQMQQYLSKSKQFAQTLSDSLGAPGSNEALKEQYSDALLQSDGLNINLTDSLLSMITTVKLLMLPVVARTNYMLSGELADVPANGSIYEGDLGLIEIPKMMLSIEEKAHLGLPPASMYTEKSSTDGGKATSDNGLLCASHLDSVLDDMISILKIELYAQSYLYEKIPALQERINELHEDHAPFNTQLFARYKMEYDDSFSAFMEVVDDEYNLLSENPFYRTHSIISSYTMPVMQVATNEETASHELR